MLFLKKREKGKKRITNIESYGKITERSKDISKRKSTTITCLGKSINLANEPTKVVDQAIQIELFLF